jgi:cell division protein FtsI/penicillin-binding protein 2
LVLIKKENTIQLPFNKEDINLTIDGELQKYGEELMINKRGGIVAIEPKTGEILALVTAPSYDPAILSWSTTFKKLH